jgi:hypothetical protein
MSTRLSPQAAKPALLSMLVDVPRLVTAYYTEQPDPSIAAQRVAFSTSSNWSLSSRSGTGILHTGYTSTRAKLASFGLHTDQGLIDETS